MLSKSPQETAVEIRDLITSKAPLIRGHVSANLYLLEKTFSDNDACNLSPIIWILRAHIGTLDKIKLISERVPETGFDLLATARNLFENLVWLRLFLVDSDFGHMFYEQLLRQQKENIEQHLIKIDREILLFEEYERIDDENLDAVFATVQTGTATADEIARARERHQALASELDQKARRSFALYAWAAKFNGYRYQTHLLREKEIPRCRKDLAAIDAHLQKYILTRPATYKSTRWKWKERSAEVGMDDQYDFLYSYTSRLLHSTPTNIVTEKGLLDSEVLIMLEYIFVSITDIFEAIEAFEFEGKVNAFLVETP